MTGSPVLVQRGFGIFRPLEEELESCFFETVLIPVDCLAGVLRPDVVQARVAVVVRIADHVVDDFVFVNRLACLLLQSAVECAEVVAHAAADGSFFKADYLRTFFGCGAYGKES